MDDRKARAQDPGREGHPAALLCERYRERLMACAHRVLFDGWFSELEPRLVPVSSVEAAFFRIDDALAAGRAQVELMGRVLRAGIADEASEAKIQNETLFLVPRLLAGE